MQATGRTRDKSRVTCRYSRRAGGCRDLTCQYRHPFLKQRNEKGCKRKTTNGFGGYHKIKRRRYDEEVILLPDKFVGKLLGHHGCRINELKANCSAFINVSRSGDLVHYDKREISIRGTKFDINE